MEDLLKQTVKNTAHKTSFQIIVSDSKSRFKTRLNPALQLDRDKEYEIALVNLETYCMTFIIIILRRNMEIKLNFYSPIPIV